MASKLIQSFPESEQLSVNTTSKHPEFELPDASFLLYGTLEQDGFDLVITNPEGEIVVVHDYFSFSPPPNLVLETGAGLSPEMVRSLMPQSFGDDISFSGPATSGATAIKIGTITLAFGDVRVKHADGSEEKISRGDTLYKGDVIITGSRAFIKAKMLDGTRFNLGKNGEAALDDVQFDPAAKIGLFVATVRVGGFHYKSGKIGKLKPVDSTDAHSTIKTPSAFIGIRGSELDGSVDENGQTIIVHKSGYLVITDINGENEVVLGEPGHTAVIVVDGSPVFFSQPTPQHLEALGDSLPPVDTPEELAELEEEGQAADKQDETQGGKKSGAEGEGTEDDEDGGEASAGEGDEAPTLSQESETEGPSGLEADLRYYEEPLDNVGNNSEREGSINDEVVLETLDNPDTSIKEEQRVEPKAEKEVAFQEDLPSDNIPAALDDTIAVSSSGSIDLSELILGNDEDRDSNQTPRLSTVTSLNGTGSLDFDSETNQLTYTPDEVVLLALDDGETVTETFSYTVVSGGITDTATVTLKIVGSNDTPIAEADIVDTREDSILKIEVLANDEDPDQNDVLSIIQVDTDGILGAIQIEEDGEFINYIPPQALAQGELLTETFSYTISDGDATTTGTVTVTVTGVNNPPVISNDNPVAIPSNSGLTEILLSDIFGDSDLGSDLTVLEVDTTLTKGTIIVGSIFYDPGNAFDFLAEGETGTDSFGITVEDEFGATGSGRYTLNIPGVNDAPLASADSYNLNENTTLVVNPFSGVLGNDADPEGGTLLLQTAPNEGPANGLLTLNADGSFTYTPNAGFSGADGFTYLISDPQGLLARGAVNLNVAPDIPPPVVNPPPPVNNLPTGAVTISNLAPIEGETLFATETLNDPDGLGAITLSWESSTDAGLTWDFIVASASLVVSTAEIGNILRVVATYTDSLGNLESVSSGPTSAVLGIAVNNPPTGTVDIDNLVPVDGDTLTASNTLADVDGLGVIAYSWESSSDDGLTWDFLVSGPTFSVGGTDIGNLIRVAADYVDALGNPESVVSGLTIAVSPMVSAPLVDFAAPGPFVTVANGDFETQTIFDELDGDALVYNVTGLPPGVTSSTDTATKVVSISGSPTATGIYNIVVTASDLQGTATDSYALAVLSPDPSSVFSGDGVYTFRTGIDDEVVGLDPVTATLHTLTFSGRAESGDIFSQSDGVFQILLDDLGNDLTVINDPIVMGGADVDTITVQGLVVSPSNIFGELGPEDLVINETDMAPNASVSDVSFINHGSLNVFDTNVGFNGTFTQSPTGLLFIRGNGVQANLTLSNNTTIDGQVILHSNGFPATLSVDPGNTFDVSGAISSIGFSTPNVLSGDLSLSSGGSLYVGNDLTFLNAGNLVDLTNGLVEVEPGRTLEVLGGQVILGNNVDFVGGGTLRVDGSEVLVTGGLDLDQGGFDFDFSLPGLTFSNVTAAPELVRIGPGVTLGLQTVIINTDLENAGHLLVSDSGNQINSQTFTNLSGALLEVDSSNSTPNSDLAIAGPGVTVTTFTNDGILVLNSSDTSGSQSSLSVLGNLINNGEILALDTSGAQGIANHTISTTLVNNGILRIPANLALSGLFDHTSSGLIDLRTNELRLSTAKSFSSTGTIIGEGSIDNSGMATPFALNGTISPETNLTGTNTATISFTGDVDVGPVAVFDLDITGPGEQDRVDVSGNTDFDPLFASTGSYNLNFLPGHGVGNGDVLSGVIFAGIVSGDPGANINHNLGAAYSLSADITTTSTVGISITAAFDNTFSGTVDSDYSTPGNWSNISVPVSGEDVLINGTSFVTVNAPTSAINSFSLEDTASLVIGLNGLLAIDMQSETRGSTTLTLESGGVLEVLSTLSNGGTFTWSGGQLTDLNEFDPPTSTVDNPGTVDLDTTNNPLLDLTLENRGNLNISGAGLLTSTSIGSGAIDNFGDIHTGNKPTIDIDITNQADGSLNIQSTSSTTVDVTISGDVFNDGVINIGSTTTSTSTTQSTFTGNVTNNGMIEVTDSALLGGVNTIIFDVSGGTLDNIGEIKFLDISGGATLLQEVGSSIFTNSGLIDVESSATINGAGYTLDSSGGAINVGSNATLTLSDDVTLQVDASSSIAGEGVFAFTGSPTLELFGDASLGVFQFNLGTTGSAVSTITGGSSTLFVEPNKSLTLDSKDLVDTGVNLVNAGTVNLLGDGITIQGGFQNELSGILNINNAGAFGSSFISFENSFTNDGSIFFNQDVGAINKLTVREFGAPGTLTNNGFFLVTQTSTDTQANLFQGILDNQGSLSLDYSLDINEILAPVTHTSSGVIELFFGEGLTLGANNSLAILPGGKIGGEGTVDVSASGVLFTMDGLFEVGGEETTNLLTVLGDTQFGPSGGVLTELGGTTPAITHDVLALDTATLAGRLKVDLITSYSPAATNTFTILTATIGLLGSFDTVDGLDFLPSGTLVLDYDQSSSQVELTAVTVDFVGTPGDDFLVGTSTPSEFLTGLDGNDELSNIGPLDTAYGGTGDDIFYASTGFKRIDGGDGFDAVAYPQSVDYRNVEGHVFERIEAISIDDGMLQLLEFDAAAIVRMVDADQQSLAIHSSLAIVGDSGDKVILHGDFFENGDRALDVIGVSHVFRVFTEGDVSLLINELLELEVLHNDGSVGRYGGIQGDFLSGTGLNDTLSGGPGDDTLDGQAGADVLDGGEGNDSLLHNPGDILVDGGTGVDSLVINSTLLGGGSIDLTGVTNLDNIERLDMTNGTLDILQIDITDVLNIVGDNSLEAFLPDGNTKLFIEGDSTDTVVLGGQDLSNIVGNALPAGVTSDFTPTDVLGDGQLYIKFVDMTNSIDLYVHTNLVDPDPVF